VSKIGKNNVFDEHGKKEDDFIPHFNEKLRVLIRNN